MSLDNFWAVFLFVVSIGVNINGNAEVGYDHCSKNNFDNNSTFMQFTKEVVSKEFATIGTFKSLHCCAKGYRTIEWFKDNKPYPWPESSSFILYPGAENQTIYTRSTTASDKGTYSCRLRNDTHLSTNDVNLEIFERSPDHALINYISQDRTAEIGSTVRLYCEAFVGHISLPDAQSKIHWRYTSEGETIERPHNATETPSRRENGAVVGVILHIPEVKRHHFGRYDCYVRLAGSEEYIKKSAILSDSGVSMVEDTRWEYSNHLALAVVPAIICAIFVFLMFTCIRKKNQSQNSEICHKMAANA